jgi:uncharacterized membrane protein YeaQ/YmgE (transglycosylase-associated protein family)
MVMVIIQNLIVALIVGAVLGWLISQIKRDYGFGLIGNIVFAVIGAIFVAFVFPPVGIAYGILASQTIKAVCGAVFGLVVVWAIKKAGFHA